MNQARSPEAQEDCVTHSCSRPKSDKRSKTGGPRNFRKRKFRCWRRRFSGLTRTVLDSLQSSVAGVSENLKHAVQDDASKMLASLSTTCTPANANLAPWVENQKAEFSPRHILNNKESGMKDIKSELARAKDTLKTKSDKLEELDGESEERLTKGSSDSSRNAQGPNSHHDDQRALPSLRGQ